MASGGDIHPFKIIQASNGALVKMVLLDEERKRIMLCGVKPLAEMSDDQIIAALKGASEISEILRAKGFIVEM